MSNQNAPIVIIGTGLAGYNLAKEFRKLNKESELVLITQDNGAFYSKPMLSTGFTKKKSPSDLLMFTVDAMAEQINASILTHTAVTAIDTEAKTLSLKGEDLKGEGLKGESQAYKELSYDKLVLACGADVISIPPKGDAGNESFPINDLEDYQRFYDAIQGKRKVLVMGAGLIGCEFANDLSNGGFEVEVVAPCDHVLPALLPQGAASAVQAGLEDLGVRFHLGPVIDTLEYSEGEHALCATLSNGTVIDTDIVVSAIGLRPRTQLAKETGLEVNRGVVVNRLLETSARDVYSFGDCAEVDGHVLQYVLPLMAGARALAKTLNGEEVEVSYGVMPIGVKTPACPLVVNPPVNTSAGEWRHEAEGQTVRASFTSTAGELLGFALTGDAIKEKMALSQLVPDIMA